MRIKFFIIILASAMFFILGNADRALAYQIETLKAVPVENDFVLGGGKIELYLSPGENYTKEITVTNRLGRPMNFKVNTEDFKGSKNIEDSIVLLGEEKGPYSLKDYLKIDKTEFVLEHGQRMILPVEISIPFGAEPGGLYGSVLVSAHPVFSKEEAEAEKAKGQIALITRLGSLFYIRIKGDAREDGFLKEFSSDKNFYENGPVSFKFLFENTGNVYLKPQGKIEIENIFGKKTGEMNIDPYFVLPDSVKFREIKWEKGLLFGRYKAILSLNRGYGDISDRKEIIFWVIPWKIVLGSIAALALIIKFLYWFGSKFEIKRKSA